MTDQPPKYDIEIDDSMPQGLRVTREHPYHTLVVIDLAGPAGAPLQGALQSGVVNVTADTFDAVMAGARPSVRYTAADPLTPGGAMVEVALTFDSLRSFDPKNILAQLAGTRSLLAIRDRFVARLRGKIAASVLQNDVAKAVGADGGLGWLADSMKWAPAAPSASPDAVDSLLGQIDFGDGSTDAASSPPRTPIGALVAAAAGGGATIPTEEASVLRRTLAETDRRLSIWLTAVLHSPQVQAVEGAWRSLAFLVAHTEFRKGLRVSLLHAPRGELLERFRTLVIDPIFDAGADAPDLIVVDSLFSNSAPDMEALDEVAQHGASLPAVLLAGVSAAFFGVKNAWQIPTLPTIANMFDQWQFAKWKTLRTMPYARSLGVVFGRGLLRAPYQRGESGDLEYAYREECLSEKDLLWAGGAIAAAATVARSVADTGWPSAMAGMVHGRLEGFASAQGGPKGDKTFGPSDVLLPQPKIEELAVAGINAAVGIRDHEDILVWNGLTAARPLRMDTDALLEVSLPYQLFAGRLSALLFMLKPHLGGMAADKVPAFVTQHLRDWLPFDGEPTAEQIKVQTRSSESDPKALELAVTVTPPATVLPGGIPVVMGYRLG